MKSPLEHLIHIREVLSLNMSDLAYVLGTNRETVCSLIEGKEPTWEVLRNIHRLSRLANEIELLNIDRIDTFLKRPIFDGHSLLDKFKYTTNISENLQIIKQVAAKEAKARAMPKGSGKNIPPLSDAAGDYSIPLYYD